MEKPDGDRSEQLVEKMVRQIRGWRLTLPAILALEIVKPISFLASQGLLLCQPLLGFFYNEDRITDYVDLLADRSNLDHLIARLETGSLYHRDDGKETSR
jgi:hypothetical protein